jgi:hypothetical protein
VAGGLISSFGDARAMFECEVPILSHPARHTISAPLLIVALVGPVFRGDGEITSATRVIALVQTLTPASVISLIGELGMIFCTSVAVIIAGPWQRRPLLSVFQGRGGPVG